MSPAFRLEVPDSINLGSITPPRDGDADETVVVVANVNWMLQVEDNSGKVDPKVGLGNGHMTMQPYDPGHPIQLKDTFEVKKKLGKDPNKVKLSDELQIMYAGTPGSHTLRTVYHQDVTYDDLPGNYKIVVTWVLSASP